jgi:flagellar basal-body rod protein FlgC
MTLMTAIAVSASGLTAQRKRVEILVSNIANAHTTQPPGMEPIRRKDVLLSAVTPQASFGAEFEDAVQGVEVSQVWTDPSEPKMVSDPGHKHADENGMVAYPNVNTSEEMVKLLSATRSYEANIQAVAAAKDMAQKTLEILR